MEGLNMSIRYTKEFKQDAVNYYITHKEVGIVGCSKNLGISKSAMSKWVKESAEHDGVVQAIGSGNFSSDEAKENARLKRELRDAQDALDILKKAISILGK